jgi:hypothetical protein
MIKIQKLKIYSIKTIIFVSMISIFYTKATHSACDVPLLNKTEEWLFENAPKLSGVIASELYLKAVEAFQQNDRSLRTSASTPFKGSRAHRIMIDDSLLLIGKDTSKDEEPNFEVFLDPRFWRISPDLITSQTQQITLIWEPNGKSDWSETLQMNEGQPTKRSQLEKTFLQFWPKEPISKIPGLEGRPLPRGFTIHGNSQFEIGFTKLEVNEVNVWMTHDKSSKLRIPYNILMRLKVIPD